MRRWFRRGSPSPPKEQKQEEKRDSRDRSPQRRNTFSFMNRNNNSNTNQKQKQKANRVSPTRKRSRSPPRGRKQRRSSPSPTSSSSPSPTSSPRTKKTTDVLNLFYGIATKNSEGVISKNSIQLVDMEIKAKVNSFLCDVSVSQTFKNLSDGPCEGVFCFPLDDTSAALYNFCVVIGGEEKVAVLKEKEKAVETYDDEISSGNSAFLLETEKDIFKLSLGNIEPKKDVQVILQYVCQLAAREGNPLWTFPTSLVLPTISNEGFKFASEIEIEMPSPIKNVVSSHASSHIETKGSQSKVTLKGDQTILQTNLVVTVEIENPSFKPLLEISENGSVAICVPLVPDLSEFESSALANTEVIFVLDQSGSMRQEEKIQSLIMAMQLFLRSLPAGIYFNIFGFGSNYYSLFPESVSLDENTFAQASSHLSQLDASLGGTNLLSPLTKILQERSDSVQRFRHLFILTDGQVSTPSETLAIVSKNSHKAKIFSFGIGSDVNKEFIKGMARASGGGKSEFIGSLESLESTATTYISRGIQPCLTNVQLKWVEGLEHKVSLSPLQVAPLVHRIASFLFMMIPDKAILPKFLEVSCVSPSGKPASYLIDFASSQLFDGLNQNKLVHRLTARAFIRDLEEGRSQYHEAGRLKSGISQDFVDNEILTLGMKYQLASSQTSFVSSLKQTEATETAMEIQVPQQPTPVQRQPSPPRQPIHHNIQHVAPPPAPPSSNSNSNSNAITKPISKAKVNLEMKKEVANTRDRDRDRDRGRGKEKEVSYKPRYRDRSASRSPSPTHSSSWKPRARSRSPIRWSASGSNNKKERRRSRSRSRSPSPTNKKSALPPSSKQKMSGGWSNKPDSSSSIALPDKEFYSVLEAQTFDGSWELSSQLISIFNKSEKECIDFVVDLCKLDQSNPQLKKIVATILAVAYLQALFPSRKNATQLVQKKALRWLQNWGRTEEEIQKAHSFFVKN